MKICEYSSYKNSRFFVSSTDGNFSDVWDKLIRLTAKLTECYASDIYFEMSAMERRMEENRSFDWILFLRECGVNSCPREEIEELPRMDLSLELQQWEIVYNAETQEITLTRVSIR